MLQLTDDEFKNLMFQNGTSSLPNAKEGWDKENNTFNDVNLITYFIT